MSAGAPHERGGRPTLRHLGVVRRAGGVPIPYITGHLEFMGLDIAVRWDSPLAPPGAQLLVETALQWARSRTPDGLIAAEVGAGCGAITPWRWPR